MQENVPSASRYLTDDYNHLEDMALKTAALFFGSQFAPYVGEAETLDYIAPTESIHLEARQMFQDFNYRKKNGELCHFEFESDNVTIDDLRRFREYDAIMGRVYKVPVTTYVICSASARSIRSELTEGINTYRVKIIRLKDENVDRIYQNLSQKRTITKEDVIPVLLSPLMSGSSPAGERIISGLKLIEKIKKQPQNSDITDDDITHMQAILYALSVKLLSPKEQEKVKEELSMTALGQMLVEDGINKGIIIGMRDGLDQGRSQGLSQGLIKGTIITCRDLGAARDFTFRKIIAQYHLTEEDALQNMEKYWDSDTDIDTDTNTDTNTDTDINIE
jgi:hypothetical protein